MLTYPVYEYLGDWQDWSCMGPFSVRNPGLPKTLLLLKQVVKASVSDSRNNSQVSEGMGDSERISGSGPLSGPWLSSH